MFILQQNNSGNNKPRRRNKVSVKYSEENSVFGKSLISSYSIVLGWGEEQGWRWALIRDWALINFFFL